MAADRHTFIFTDLVGYTALTAAEGDERAAEVAFGFYECVRRLLERYRAEEIKAIGDALMLRCEDPRLAIELGCAIVLELSAKSGFPPVRVGMDTGPAVSRGGDWYGSTVNVAARLCSAAAAGEVLVSEATREAAGALDELGLDERRLHWLKNVIEPVAARIARPLELSAKPSPGACS